MNGVPFVATTNLVAALEILAKELRSSSFIWVDAVITGVTQGRGFYPSVLKSNILETCFPPNIDFH